MEVDMYQKKFEAVNNTLDFARHNMNTLIALFGYKDNAMMCANKTRAICSAECIISIMSDLIETIKNDDGKGDGWNGKS